VNEKSEMSWLGVFEFEFGPRRIRIIFGAVGAKIKQKYLKKEKNWLEIDRVSKTFSPRPIKKPAGSRTFRVRHR